MNRILLFIIVLSFFIAAMISCSKEGVNNPVGNQPPDTGLFLYPDSTINQQPSRLNVHWWGDDPDGVIIGFYFKWEGIDSGWTFTASNDSIFALPIGSSDTTYLFSVSAVDAGGNNVYDQTVERNGINFGPEPFVDANGDGIYNEGEPFFDIGLIDPTPAELLFPIKNTPPVLTWNELTVVPDTSFPVMTFKWDVTDLDGDESIKFIRIALNDTANFVSLNGTVRLVTLRINDLNGPDTDMEILINGSDQNIHTELLSGLILDNNNKIYLQAEDLSGARSEIISLPDTSGTWYVKKPKGQLLIFDDYRSSGISNEVAKIFYNQVFSTLGGGSLAGKFDQYDLANQPLPFESVTLLETMKLFDYAFWYSYSDPRLDILNIVTNKYIQFGGKIAFSMTFQDSTSEYLFDLSNLQGFLPVDSLSLPEFVFTGADVLPSAPEIDYPALKTNDTNAGTRTYSPNPLVTTEIYNLVSPDLNGNIAFITNDKTKFFIGLFLHYCNGGDQNVDELLEKVFFEEFGLVP